MFSRDRTSRLTHSELIRLNRFPNAAAREVARAAEVYERALSIVRRTIESGHQFNLTSSAVFLFLSQRRSARVQTDFLGFLRKTSSRTTRC